MRSIARAVTTGAVALAFAATSPMPLLAQAPTGSSVAADWEVRLAAIYREARGIDGAHEAAANLCNRESMAILEEVLERLRTYAHQTAKPTLNTGELTLMAPATVRTLNNIDALLKRVKERQPQNCLPYPHESHHSMWPQVQLETKRIKAQAIFNQAAYSAQTCDRQALEVAIRELQGLELEARRVAKAAADLGKFSVVGDAEAKRHHEAILDWLRKAQQLQIENCPNEEPEDADKQVGMVSPQPPLDKTAAALLAYHNQVRVEVGAPPLRWNAALQTSASAYAAELARTGRLAHAPRAGRGIERENLSKGLIGWDAGQMLASWIEEKRDFIPGLFPNVSRTENWYDIGHYSQMIWPETTEIGCGMATGSGYQWLVCRYSPGGNKDGKPVGIRPRP